jgi:hypothetical protein
MQRLSVLIFSKDDLEQALGLIRSLHDLADEIVLMDASSKSHHAWIEKRKEQLGLEKLKIYKIIALGYREPLMMYALRKCRNSWVLAINTDERISDGLNGGIISLINDKGYDAYAIPLYSVHGPKSRTFVSYQVRLFRKEKIDFRGLLHEKPIVKGKYKTLRNEGYTMEHKTTGMLHTTKGSYAEMERFQRFTYAQYNARVLDQADRAMRVPEEESGRLSGSKKVILGLLRLYETLGFKPQDRELSNFDYFMYWLARVAAHQTRRRSASGVIKAFPSAFEYIGKMKEWRKGPYADMDFEIAKMINKVGVTKFLGLEKESTVDALNKKYMNREQGVELLINLLREKYRKLCS